jgi:mycofactocin system glycosyltransferase
MSDGDERGTSEEPERTTNTASPPAAIGLPVGFGIEFDPTLRRPAADVLVGGTPSRMLRLSGRGLDAFAELESGKVRSAAGGVLARRLTDAGLAHPQPPAAAEPDLVVIVPAYGRPDLLDRCLTALGRAFPVLVVDDASPQPPTDVVARHGAALIRRETNGGPGAARNTGLAATDTELVAFVDSDAAARPEVLAALAGHLADPAVAAAAPRIRIVRTTARTTGYVAGRSALDLGARPAAVRPDSHVTYVPSTVLVVRRSCLGAGFDEALRVGEDVDLVWRLHDAGHVVRYDPSVAVAHVEPRTWSGLLGRRYRYGGSAAHLTRRHPGRLTPLVVEPWTGAGTVALLAGRPRVAAAALAGAVVAEWRRRGRLGLPRRTAPVVVARRAQAAWRNCGGWAVRFLGPVLAVAVMRQVRLGRMPAGLLALVLAEPIASWWAARDRAAGPITHVLGHLAEDIAYGAGVMSGCARERTVEPVLPTVRRV